jgi:hypothetical protein
MIDIIWTTCGFINDYFIQHPFRPIVRLYFLDYSDDSIIRQVGFSDVFNPIAKVIKINTVVKWYCLFHEIINRITL